MFSVTFTQQDKYTPSVNFAATNIDLNIVALTNSFVQIGTDYCQDGPKAEYVECHWMAIGY